MAHEHVPSTGNESPCRRGLSPLESPSDHPAQGGPGLTEPAPSRTNRFLSPWWGQRVLDGEARSGPRTGGVSLEKQCEGPGGEKGQTLRLPQTSVPGPCGHVGWSHPLGPARSGVGTAEPDLLCNRVTCTCPSQVPTPQGWFRKISTSPFIASRGLVCQGLGPLRQPLKRQECIAVSQPGGWVSETQSGQAGSS